MEKGSLSAQAARAWRSSSWSDQQNVDAQYRKSTRTRRPRFQKNKGVNRLKWWKRFQDLVGHNFSAVATAADPGGSD